jgi:hypothetical protein
MILGHTQRGPVRALHLVKLLGALPVRRPVRLGQHGTLGRPRKDRDRLTATGEFIDPNVVAGQRQVDAGVGSDASAHPNCEAVRTAVPGEVAAHLDGVAVVGLPDRLRPDDGGGLVTHLGGDGFPRFLPNRHLDLALVPGAAEADRFRAHPEPGGDPGFDLPVGGEGVLAGLVRRDPEREALRVGAGAPHLRARQSHRAAVAPRGDRPVHLDAAPHTVVHAPRHRQHHEPYGGGVNQRQVRSAVSERDQPSGGGGEADGAVGPLERPV